MFQFSERPDNVWWYATCTSLINKMIIHQWLCISPISQTSLTFVYWHVYNVWVHIFVDQLHSLKHYMCHHCSIVFYSSPGLFDHEPQWWHIPQLLQQTEVSPSQSDRHILAKEGNWIIMTEISCGIIHVLVQLQRLFSTCKFIVNFIVLSVFLMKVWYN